MNNKGVEALKGTKNVKNIRTLIKIAKDGENRRRMKERRRDTTWGKQSLTSPKISGGCCHLNQGSK